VALGIIGRPDLLFLDEPTTGFDPEARREFWGLIRGLRATGTTIVLGRVALVLGLWCVVALVLCLTTFRWTTKRDG